MNLFASLVTYRKAEWKTHLIFQDFSPYGIIAFTASSVLQGIRSSLLRLHTLRLEAAVKSVIADFRF